MSPYQLFKRTINFNYSFLHRAFGDRPFTLLDVGAGNHSARRITSLFPHCEYHGLDMNRDYNYDEADFRLMKSFYEIDLTRLEYGIIPDGYFDAIWMVHVMEHLINGDEVVVQLLKKLKPGGYLYLEYPGIRSTRLPSMYGTLNFYDDPTHVRIYSVKELTALLHVNECTVKSSGLRRNWYYLAATPFRVLAKTLSRKKLEANLFWDLLGFAEYVFARKNA